MSSKNPAAVSAQKKTPIDYLWKNCFSGYIGDSALDAKNKNLIYKEAKTKLPYDRIWNIYRGNRLTLDSLMAIDQDGLRAFNTSNSHGLTFTASPSEAATFAINPDGPAPGKNYLLVIFQIDRGRAEWQGRIGQGNYVSTPYDVPRNAIRAIWVFDKEKRTFVDINSLLIRARTRNSLSTKSQDRPALRRRAA